MVKGIHFSSRYTQEDYDKDTRIVAEYKAKRDKLRAKLAKRRRRYYNAQKRLTYHATKDSTLASRLLASSGEVEAQEPAENA